MERKITNHAENQSVTKKANQRRISCLGRNAYAMLIALMLFVGMGTALHAAPPQVYSFWVERSNGANGENFTTLSAAVASINTRAYACNLYINEDCTLNEAITFTSTRNYAVTIYGNNHTITRGSGVIGDLITYNRTVASALIINDLTLDGNNVSVTGSLLKFGASVQLTLSNITAINHTASADGVCAVDASAAGGANYVQLNTAKIIGNTANGKPANLKIPGNNTYTRFNTSLTDDIGITTTNSGLNTEFARWLDANNTGWEHLKNDVLESNGTPYQAFYSATGRVRWISAENNFYVERNNGADGESFSTLSAAVASINDRNYACNLHIFEDCTLNEAITITSTRNQAVTIFGNGHTVTRGSGATGNMITYARNSELKINNLTLDGANASATGALLYFTGTGALTVSDSEFKGSTTASTGSLISKSVSNNSSAVTFTNTVFSGNATTGDLLSFSQSSGSRSMNVSFNNCTINGASNGNGNLVSHTTNSGTFVANNTTFTRNQSTGYGCYITSSGAETFTDCTFDGSNTTTATQPLLKSGTGALTLTNTTVENHTVSAANVCAVDATSSSNVTIYGSTKITGNTANSAHANLNIPSDASKTHIANTLTENIGITTTNYALESNFAVLDNLSDTGWENLKNDKLDDAATSYFVVPSASKSLRWTASIFYVEQSNGTNGQGFSTLSAAVASINSRNYACNLYIGEDYTLNEAVTFTTRNQNVTIYGNNHTITRGSGATGDLITWNRTAELHINDLTIDGDNINSTGSLIKMTANGTLSLTNFTAQNHVASAEGICAVDASAATTANHVKIYSASIFGNTANGNPANLKITGTTCMYIYNSLTQNIGITNMGQYQFGKQFGYKYTASLTGMGHLKNDLSDGVSGISKGQTIVWGASPDDLDAMFGNPDYLIHDLKTYPTASDLEAVPGGALLGENNEDPTLPYMVWKSVSYNDDNSVDVTLNYFQKQVNLKLDFIFVIDETGTMDGGVSANGYSMTQAQWARHAALEASRGVLQLNVDYPENNNNNRVCFISWGGSTVHNSGFIDNFNDALAAIDYDVIGGGTDHSLGIGAATNIAEQSAAEGNQPIVVYLSDYHSAFNDVTDEEIELLKAAAELIYPFCIFDTYSAERKARMNRLAPENYHHYTVNSASDPAELITPFIDIIHDAVSHCGDGTVVEDVLANGLVTAAAANEVTSNNGTGYPTNAIINYNGTETWILLDDANLDDNLLNTGRMYTQIINIPMTDDVYSGAMSTNNGLTLENDGVEVNRIDDSPLLSKALTLVLKGNSASGAPLAGATFTLTHGSNTWNLTTDANGQLVLPWGENDGTNTFAFNVNESYTLTQTATINGYVRPGGTWTLSVGSDYKITSTTTPGAGNVNRTRDMVAVGGKFEIYNDSEPTLTYVPNGGTGTPISVGTIDFPNNATSLAYTTLTKDESGFSFGDRTLIGWNTEGDCSGTSYGLGANITLSRGEDENIVLYAQWSGEPIIARVSNDNGATWTMHSYLINRNYDPDGGDSSEKQGAFAKANELNGNVIIETLFESHERYTLDDGGFQFDNTNITSLTLRTTQDQQWNPATDRFTSTISRGDDFGSLLDFNISDASFTIENIILDGGYNSADPYSGYFCSDNGGLVYMESGTLHIKDATLRNSYADGSGGGIYTAGDVYLSGTVTFTGCVADANGGGAYCNNFIATDGTAKIFMTNCATLNSDGGGIYAEGSVTINGEAEFTNCSIGYDPSSKPSGIHGGAIFADNITLNGNISFDGCKSSYFGGALSGNTISLSTSSPDDMISITNCSANNGCSGGGIYANGPVNLAGNVTITGCSAVAHQDPNGAKGAGGGIYLTGNASLTMSGLIVIEGNTHGKGDVDDDVYLDAASEKYVTIGEDGLECGSHIGIYKTSGYTNDANSVSQTVIAQGAGSAPTPATNCANAFRNGYFFDDRSQYGVYNLSYGTDYTNDKLYFIETWEGQASTAEANTDYVLSGDYVSEVKTTKGMAYFAKDVNNGKDYSGKTVTLSNDIDLSGRYWVPIGQAAMGSCSTSGNPFKGTFNGQGKIISNMMSILPYQYMGLFGNVENGTITRTFVESGDLVGTCENGYMGGLVGSLDDGTVTYSEAMVSLTNSTNANCTMGGLVGWMDGDIHSSMAMAEMTNGTKMGGLVGTMAINSILKNSFANPKFNIDDAMTTWTIGGLAGSIVETEIGNCYVMQRGTVPTAATGKVFGWLAGDADEISVHHCYIPDGYTNYFGSGTESVSESGAYTATELVNNKYGYGQDDQKVGENDHLVDLLNNWVGEQDAEDGYAQWTRTMASPINGDYPVLMMPAFDGIHDNVCLTSKDGLFITYNTDLNNEIQKYNAATGGGNIYLYATNPTEINTNTDDNVRVYIHENVGVLQADGNKLNARVGVTFDNSSNNMLGGKNYDWHMFSTSLSDASLGINYGTPAAGVGFGHQIADGDITLTKYGYYPTNTPFASFDFYAYDEPSRHYINLKRYTGNHWHQATQEPIEYTNEENLLKGKGYLMAIDKETMLMADGVLNNGDVTTEELKYTTSENEGDAKQTGVNLIGNPYQSYLDFNEFLNHTDNSGKILDMAYYILDADKGAYIAYANDGSSNPEYAPQFIHPHQGFFVAVPEGTTQLTFTNDMRLATGNDYSNFRDEHIDYPLVNLICTDSDGKRDFTTVEINRPELGGARKMHKMHTGNASLYAHFNNKSYQALFAPEGVREVPVRLDVFEDGVFTMTWSMFHGDFSYVHLIDNMTGADIDLTATDSYRFEASTDDYASRFRLVFDVTGIEEYDDDQDGLSTGSGTFAFFDGNTWVVNGEGTLQLFDVNGRCLMSTNAEGTQSSVNLPKVATGVYLLRLTNGDGPRVQKIVVK